MMGCNVFLLLKLLLISEFHSHCSCLSHQYHFVNINLNWTDAQAYCRENYTDLATIDNMKEMKRLTESVDTDYTGKAWIGLMKGTSWRWQWSSGEGDTGYTNWDIDNLILVNRTMTWNEALNYCRTHHSDLVSVHNEEIQYWVSRRAEKASTDHVWLGLRFSCYMNFWFWVSAENVCYQNWAPNNISNSNLCGTTGAVQSKDPHYWVSLPETKELNFICSKYPILTGKKTVVRLTVRTDGEIKDPEFSNHLLKQLQEKLISAGMSEGSKLSWRTQPDGQIFHLMD
ncbi:putative C-type lectin domain family 20 member A [Paramormyrops kingsleyae]|uniref:putative C-type lectin domain family 20 member A n=1 Tax=Paramormyrops kingsleyae TaxID=1676925 RepID=UPI003B973C04